MGALLAMAAANAAILLGAHEILLRVRLGRCSLDLLLFLLLRVALVSGVVLLSLCTQGFTPLALGMAGGAALLGLLLGGAHRRLPRLRDPGLGPWILAAAALLGLRLLAQVWVFAPYIPDPLSYHLPKIAEWVRSGGLSRELGADPRAPFPAGFELVEAWWCVFLHHDVLIEMAGVEFLALGAAAVAALARQLELSPRAAAFAALLYALGPGVQLQTTACMNDAPLAALYLTSAVLILVRAPWPLVLLAAGMATGLKPTFVYLSPGLALLAWLERRRPALPCPAPRAALALAALGILLGGFWYGRNLGVYGNPLHPMTARGILDANGDVLVPASPSAENLKWNALALERRLDDRISPYSAQLKSQAGWGIGCVALGLPALLLLLRRAAALRRLGAGFALSLLCLLVSISTDPYNLRFALFFTALPCIAAVRMAEQSRPIRFLAIAALALQFLGTSVANELPDGGLGTLLRTPWRERQGLSLPAVALPKDAVGVFAGGLSKGYLLYGPGFERRVVYLRSKDLPSLIADLQRERLTLFTGGGSPILQQGVREGVLIRDVGTFYRLAR